eukprot:CAMPEP_0206199174 /NCGR_PEP_ID=MMETSP0166-20121206/10111_1 /ASSEMBLY_ACC=CAM_ASM_000260 /TAXON_ID=95228 /ORGANISM="Vannella robusta, Strain DIVA3 518/3/11/1/6" /LENGTH=213 /DNA_ID=CAMNT_0053617239 /DNA_START=498 /DNA_END=1139 /DNA_ORIENTATION=-
MENFTEIFARFRQFLDSMSLLRRVGSTFARIDILAGSVVDFEGDAIVNAANEGCTGGFGVDEVINNAGGFALKEARKALGGCSTGHAKITPSFNHEKVKWIIHAVGPVYRIPFGCNLSSEEVSELFKQKDVLLESTYIEALHRAQEKQVKTLAFCLLCAGVFRGQRDLVDILEIGLRTIDQHIYEGLEHVAVIAYTKEEQEKILIAADRVWPR